MAASGSAKELTRRMMSAMTDARTSAPDSPDTDLDRRDRAVVEGQIGRAPRAMAGVGARCVFGYPAATHQAPRDEDGHPFPTAYYLTCPHLVKQIDRLESTGGVRRYEALVAEDPRLRATLDAANARHSALDGRGHDIAASSTPGLLKCLHAHAAFQLSAGDHPIGAAVLAEAAPRWCDDARCATWDPATATTS